MKGRVCFVALMMGFCFFYAQDKQLDSLWSLYNQPSQPDSNRVRILRRLAGSYSGNNPDTAIILARQGLSLAEKTGQKKDQSLVFNVLGVSYDNKGDYPKALEYYLRALKIVEELGDKRGKGACYNNIGTVYYAQRNYDKALKMREELADKGGIAVCYINAGNVYADEEEYAKAQEFYGKGLKMYEAAGDKMGLGNCYTNIGNVYASQEDYSQALEYCLKALKLKEEIGDKRGIEACYINLADLYNLTNKYAKALTYSNSALRISEEIGDVDGERLAYNNLSIIYGKTGRYKEAYENHVRYKQLTDSIFNADNSKLLGDMKTNFEVQKKEVELKAKAEAQQVINAEERKRQQFFIYMVIGVLLLVMVFSGFLYNRFRLTQKQKKLIEAQKVLVDDAYAKLHEKNKEVMDSILYAKRIQTALLTSEKYIGRNLKRLMER